MKKDKVGKASMDQIMVGQDRLDEGEGGINKMKGKKEGRRKNKVKEYQAKGEDT